MRGYLVLFFMTKTMARSFCSFSSCRAAMLNVIERLTSSGTGFIGIHISNIYCRNKKDVSSNCIECGCLHSQSFMVCWIKPYRRIKGCRLYKLKKWANVKQSYATLSITMVGRRVILEIGSVVSVSEALLYAAIHSCIDAILRYEELSYFFPREENGVELASRHFSGHITNPAIRGCGACWW